MTVIIETPEPLYWQLERTGRGLLLSCDELQLVLEADASEAASIVEEGLQEFFRDHAEAGTLDDLLAQHGWRATLPSSLEDLRFEVPWEWHR